MLEVTYVLILFGLSFALITFRIIYRAYFTSLRDIPGPWLARFTRFWLARAIYSRNYHRINAELHQKWGPIVRIAPNEYSIDDADAAQIIYRSRDQLDKVRYTSPPDGSGTSRCVVVWHGDAFVQDTQQGFNYLLPQSSRYQAFDLPNVEPALFTTLNNDHNTRRRRQVLPLYQVGALTNIEFQVDSTVNIFLAKMDAFSRGGIVIDMTEWLHFYTFDTTGALTFGKPFGFIEKETDIADLISVAHITARYGSVVGIFSEWHPTIFRILQWLSPTGDYGIAYLHNFAKQAVAELSQRSEKDKLLSEEKSQGGDTLESDYLSTFLAKARRTPDAFSVDDAYYHMMSNLLAGGETTGISLTAAVYFLYKNPRSLERLRQEIEGVKKGSSNPSNSTMKELSECQYLHAIIKETVRVFSPIGISLPRVVPEGGLTLAGRFFPENTVVGICPWVARSNTSIFGPDAETFRPERWLESPASASKMDQYYFGFGRGPRACIGKNIALMELSKLIAELVLRFDIVFAGPNQDWTIRSDGFVKPEDFLVRVTERVVVE